MKRHFDILSQFKSKVWIHMRYVRHLRRIVGLHMGVASTHQLHPVTNSAYLAITHASIIHHVVTDNSCDCPRLIHTMRAWNNAGRRSCGSQGPRKPPPLPMEQVSEQSGFLYFLRVIVVPRQRSRVRESQSALATPRVTIPTSALTSAFHY